MTGKVLLLGFFAFSLTSVAAQTRSPRHPLDALTTDEYWPVHDALEESGRFADKTIVSSLLSYHLELDVDAPNNRFMIDRLVPQQNRRWRRLRRTRFLILIRGGPACGTSSIQHSMEM